MADQDLDTQWKEYKEKYNKVYDPEEDAMRRDIFGETLKRIEIHNREFEEGRETYTIGVNQFADRRPEERGCCCHCRKPPGHPDLKLDQEAEIWNKWNRFISIFVHQLIENLKRRKLELKGTAAGSLQVDNTGIKPH